MPGAPGPERRHAGVLIALDAHEELENHFRFAKQNGLTEDELAEVIYHSSGYAGFPAANNAKSAAKKALGKSTQSVTG